MKQYMKSLDDPAAFRVEDTTVCVLHGAPAGNRQQVVQALKGKIFGHLVRRMITLHAINLGKLLAYR